MTHESGICRVQQVHFETEVPCYFVTQAKIARSLKQYRTLKREVIDELVMRETEESLAATLETLESSGPVGDSMQGLADSSQLINTATARKLSAHFSLERIQRILAAAKDLLAQSSESDSGEEELTLARPEEPVETLSQVRLDLVRL